MSKIAIITDSTAYLSQETVDQYGIHVLPLKVHWEGETFRDNVDIHPQNFYEDLEKTEWLPTTSQPSMQEFLNLCQYSHVNAPPIFTHTVPAIFGNTAPLSRGRI